MTKLKEKPMQVRREWIVVALVFLLLFLGVLSWPARGQEQARACKGLVFSTEEDFLTQGPTPPDGNPIISDGDLLSMPNFPDPGVVLCARN